MRQRLTARTIQGLKPPVEGRLEVFDKLLPGFGVRLTGAGTGSYFLMYRSGLGSRRKQRRMTLGTIAALSLGEARHQARQALQAIAAGRDPGRERPKEMSGARLLPAGSFALAAGRYLAAGTRRRWRPRTAREVGRLFAVELLPVLGPRPLASITRADATELLEAIADRPAPVMANRALYALKAFFGWAIDEELVVSSPVSRVRSLARETPRERTLSDAEVAIFWAACEALDAPWRQMFRLLLLTGVRRAELAGMQWSEIDEANAVWRLPAVRMKAGKPHTVPLPALAMNILAEVPHIDPVFVFGTHGRAPAGWSNASVLPRLRARMEELAGHPIPHWAPHDLRRTCASGMAGLGVPPHIVDRLLAHAVGSRVSQTYLRHDYLAERAAALEAWASHVGAAALIRPAPAANVVRLAARREA
jgi:integrase